MKHAHAKSAKVVASVDDGGLHIEVRDDGTGGADPNGHGLVGMTDRLIALGGSLEIESPAEGGTLLSARLPLPAVERERGQPFSPPSARPTSPWPPHSDPGNHSGTKERRIPGNPR
jgi:signal transduction histidine kinase